MPEVLMEALMKLLVLLTLTLSGLTCAQSDLALLIQQEFEVEVIEEAHNQHGERFVFSDSYVRPTLLSAFLQELHARGELEGITRSVRVVFPSLHEPGTNFGVVTYSPSGHVSSSAWRGPGASILTHTHGTSRVLLDGQRSPFMPVDVRRKGAPDTCTSTVDDTGSRFVCFGSDGQATYQNVCVVTQGGGEDSLTCTSSRW